MSGFLRPRLLATRPTLDLTKSYPIHFGRLCKTKEIEREAGKKRDVRTCEVCEVHTEVPRYIADEIDLTSPLANSRPEYKRHISISTGV